MFNLVVHNVSTAL